MLRFVTRPECCLGELIYDPNQTQEECCDTCNFCADPVDLDVLWSKQRDEEDA